MTKLESIPPAPREPSPRARELIFRYQGAQKGMLLGGVLFAILGSGFATVFAWGVPADVAIVATGRRLHGRVLSAEVDRSVSSGNRHPTLIRFAYSIDGRRYQSQSSTWSGAVAARARPDASIPIEVSSLKPEWSRVEGSSRASFGYAGLFTLVFPLVGLLLAGLAIRSNRREIRAFVHGEAAKGKVVYFGPDTSVRVNGRNPWKVAWEFRVEEQVYTGSLGSMSMLALEELGKQQELVVLYDPVDPRVNTAWVD